MVLKKTTLKEESKIDSIFFMLMEIVKLDKKEGTHHKNIYCGAL